MSQRFIKWEHSHSLWFYAHASCLPANSLYYTVLFWWEKKNTHFDVLLNVSNDFRKYYLADVHVLLCSPHNNCQFCDCCQADKICLDQKGIFIYFMPSTAEVSYHKVPLFFVCPVSINFFLYLNTCSSSKTTFYSSIVCIGLHSGVFVI